MGPTICFVCQTRSWCSGATFVPQDSHSDIEIRIFVGPRNRDQDLKSVEAIQKKETSWAFLHWKLEALSFEDPITRERKKKCQFSQTTPVESGTERNSLRVIDPEKVRVQDCLDDAGNDRDGVEMALCKVAIDPVGDVQGSVDAQGEQVVGGDGLGFPRPLQHEQLRQDGDTLQPERKGPEHLGDGPFVGEQDGEDGGAAREVRHAESVQVRVVRGFVVIQHHPEGVRGRREEDDFENGVPCTVGKCPKEICVSKSCQQNPFPLETECFFLSLSLVSGRYVGTNQGISSGRRGNRGLAI